MQTFFNHNHRPHIHPLSLLAILLASAILLWIQPPVQAQAGIPLFVYETNGRYLLLEFLADDLKHFE